MSKKYQDMDKSKFIKAEDEVKAIFYQVPKVLLHGEKYKDLNNDERMMYAVLRDRHRLSLKNKWIDEEGFVFLKYGNPSLCKLFNMSEKTVIKYKKNLVKHGLIYNRKMGQGNGNRIYILELELTEKDIYKPEKILDEDLEYEKSISEEKKKKKQEKTQAETIENSKNCKKFSSRTVKSSVLELNNLQPSNNNLNNNDFNNKSVSQEKDRQTELEEIKNNSEVFLFPENVNGLLEDAIEELYDAKYIRINNTHIPQSKIRKQLKKLNLNMLDSALKKFATAKEEKKIKNQREYFRKVLYNSIAENYVENFFREED